LNRYRAIGKSYLASKEIDEKLIPEYRRQTQEVASRQALRYDGIVFFYTIAFFDVMICSSCQQDLK